MATLKEMGVRPGERVIAVTSLKHEPPLFPKGNFSTHIGVPSLIVALV